jgi:hypothetical protein
MGATIFSRIDFFCRIIGKIIEKFLNNDAKQFSLRLRVALLPLSKIPIKKNIYSLGSLSP